MAARAPLARMSAVDRYVRFVNDADRVGRRPDRFAPPGSVVTISREAGCDAHALADALVEQLRPHAREGSTPWTVFDRNLVERVLAEHRLPAHLAEYMPEDVVSPVVDSVYSSGGPRTRSEAWPRSATSSSSAGRRTS
jgi:hypothetical protein